MPEMPEVQSVIDSLLEQDILNRKVTEVNLYLNKILKNSDEQSFKNFLFGEKFTKIDRIGKYLIFHLSNKKVLVIHLRMEGKIFFEEKENEIPTKHILVEIVMNDKVMIYHDTRRFGTFTIYTEDTYLESKELKKLALDPLQKGFDWKYLKRQIGKSTRLIKPLLLDQTVVAGIGNIYADEILFASRISPQRIGSQLTDEEYKAIVKSAASIMKKAIANKGTTISSYYYKKNQKGEFQKFLKVHTKKNTPCPVCKEQVVKITVNKRGTYVCPRCQNVKIN